MYDSVGQFYPWRNFAAETVRAGRLPLWNPHQFCGTPFIANSQSAVIYPGNLLYYLLPPARAAGWSVLLHLVLAATFTWLLLRHLGAGNAAGALGSTAFAFSTWQTAWLHLPTFLATSCWLPLVLLLTLRLHDRGDGCRVPNVGPTLHLCRVVPLGFAIGLTLLAGHLQIAFYVMLAATLLALSLAAVRWRERGIGAALRGFALFGAATVLGGMFAAPQVLPTLELSQRSHRTAPVSAQGYEAYVAYAVHVNALVTLFLPDFFGNPSRPDAPYVGVSRGGIPFNYAEGALYVGLPTLLLAVFALLLRPPPGHFLLYLGALALLALLMAFGTAIDALFYFYLPGFGQSGSPGRALVLWAFAASALAALGCDRLQREAGRSGRFAAASVVLVLALWIGTAWLGRGAVEEMGQGWTPLLRQAALFALSAGALLAMAAGRLHGGRWAALPVALVAVDLFATNLNYNPTAAPEEVYPLTPSLTRLREKVGHDRIMPINANWSFSGPRKAALPPNGAMVFGLRDVQGYDSLFPGQYKHYMNRLAGQDASPPEVGNMVFARDPQSPLAAQAGVRFLISPEPIALPGARETFLDQLYLYELTDAPGRASARTEDGRTVPLTWQEDGPTRVALALETPAPAILTLADQFYPGWHAAVDGAPAPLERAGDIFRAVRVPTGRHVVSFEYRPVGFRVGLYLLLLVATVGGLWLVACRRGGGTEAGRL